MSGRLRQRVVALAAVAAFGWLPLPGALASQRTQWDGVYTDAQAARGRLPYAQHCARCHGADMLGLPQPVRYPGGPARTPALVGNEAIATWEELTLADLFERIRISMPQNNPGSLPRPMVADLLAFILQSDGYPSGVQELPANTPALSTITIRAQR